jgi:hypothetical protein
MGDAMKQSIREIVEKDISLTYVPTATDTSRIINHKVDKINILEKYKLDKNTMIILTVGRNHPKKGFQVKNAIILMLVIQIILFTLKINYFIVS